MKRDHANDEELMAVLHEACKQRGGQRQFAKAHGFSEEFICQVRSGKNCMSERLAVALKEKAMAEIGQPERRRVLIPQTIPAEPSPHVAPTPQHEPEKVPEKVP
jgi:hypothetical protein